MLFACFEGLEIRVFYFCLPCIFMGKNQKVVSNWAYRSSTSSGDAYKWSLAVSSGIVVEALLVVRPRFLLSSFLCEKQYCVRKVNCQLQFFLVEQANWVTYLSRFLMAQSNTSSIVSVVTSINYKVQVIKIRLLFCIFWKANWEVM